MFRNVTPVVLNLLIINFLVFLALNLFQERIYEYFFLFKTDAFGIRQSLGLSTYGSEFFKPMQIVNHFFSHKDIFHFIMNMFTLYSIGSAVEFVMGSQRFFKFYLFVGVLAGILITFFDKNFGPVLGASGAISGVAVAFAMYYPDRQLMIFPIPFPIKAKYLVTGFGVISFFLAFFSTGGMVSHFGHLAGMLAALIYYYVPFIRNLLN